VLVGRHTAMTPDLEGPVSACRTREAVHLAWRRTGLSLTKLAAAMGVALATVSLWKDGRRQPSLPGALRLCRVSGVALVDFLRGDLDSIRATPAREGELPYVRPSDEHHAADDWRIVPRLMLMASGTRLRCFPKECAKPDPSLVPGVTLSSITDRLAESRAEASTRGSG
jgi:transcriptional regulator with XRE-family HTH domain